MTEPSDGLPAAAGIPGKPFLTTPPQEGFVVQAPNGLIDLAQPPEPRGAAHAAGARSVSRLATASVTEARAVPGRPGRRKSAQEREWCPASAVVPDALRRSGRTETLTRMNDTSVKVLVQSGPPIIIATPPLLHQPGDHRALGFGLVLPEQHLEGQPEVKVPDGDHLPPVVGRASSTSSPRA